MFTSASILQAFMASQIVVKGKKLGIFWKLLVVTTRYHGYVLVTIMRFLVTLKSWEGSLDRNDKWIDFVR